MPVYHQMGHDSWNLIGELGDHYRGAILSPVNDIYMRMREQMSKYKPCSDFEYIFDPQLYFPSAAMGKLPSWKYFSERCSSEDLKKDSWWKETCDGVLECALGVGASAVCSPAFVPSDFSESYYAQMIKHCNYIGEGGRGANIRTYQTVLIDANRMGQEEYIRHIVSIITNTEIRQYYVIIVGNLVPRREYSDEEFIAGAMLFMKLLESANIEVLVGFSSSDMIMWKHTGVQGCATGKFFNLRRFTRSRFTEPPEGGGQVPYWFEESLIAFLREGDLLKLIKEGMISEESERNPYYNAILDEINSDDENAAWVGLSWRQYMHWFASFENRHDEEDISANDILREANEKWKENMRKNIYFHEPLNDGHWIGSWIMATNRYEKML